MSIPRALAQRGDIDPFIAMDVMRLANEREARGENILHMEVGQPASSAPPKVIEAAQNALVGERLGYTDALGLPALREAISGHYRARYGVDVAPERIAVTTGSSAGFILVFLAILESGARVALPAPGYPAYRQILKVLGAETVMMESRPAGRWMPSPEDLAAAARGAGELDALLIASPANPTGTMLVGDTLAELAHAAIAMNIWFVSDEIYHGLEYGETAQTALQHSESAIVVNSFSKYYCMTGWRIGWIVVPQEMVRPIERLAQNLYIAPPSISQYAAVAAFDCEAELEAIKMGYAANRELLMNRLPEAGLCSFLPADGAFYLYADVRDLTNDSVSFAERMLREIGVAVTPGVDFDAENGSHYVRLCYAGAHEDMAEAATRIAGWLT